MLSAPPLDSSVVVLEGGMMDLHFSCIRIGKLYVVIDAYVVTTATHADMQVISGHTNPMFL